MSIVKWSPFKELENMRREMERLFKEFIEPTPRRRFRLWPRREPEQFQRLDHPLF
ncbi:MAG: hypothetical protein QMC83_07775 [Thermodesulfovibrionales bacterium]|nr:hypothetical protein [Thermodesulfovibrionales bacterium]